MREGNPLPREERLVDEHEARHALDGERVVPAVLDAVGERRGVEAREVARGVCLDEGREISERVEARVEREVLRREEKEVGHRAGEFLLGQPLAVVFLQDAADVADLHARMRRLEAGGDGIEEGVAVALRDVPVAAGEKPDAQGDGARLGVLEHEEHPEIGAGEERAEQGGFSLHGRTSAFARPVCTAQMASCVRSRRPSLESAEERPLRTVPSERERRAAISLLERP